MTQTGWIDDGCSSSRTRAVLDSRVRGSACQLPGQNGTSGSEAALDKGRVVGYPD